MKITRRWFLETLSAALAALRLPEWLPAKNPEENPRVLTLRNDFFHIRFQVGTEGVWIDDFRLNQEQTRPGAPFTESLVTLKSEVPELRSGTALLIEGAAGEAATWQCSRASLPLKIKGGEPDEEVYWLRIDDILLGPADDPVARERWDFELDGDELRWSIERHFLREARLVADRFPFLALRTKASEPTAPGGPARSHFTEIAGFLDPAMQIQGQSQGKTGFPEGGWFEVISPGNGEPARETAGGKPLAWLHLSIPSADPKAKSAQLITLSPSGVALASALETGSFSYAKPASDGTVDAVAIGAETLDRTGGIEVRKQGTKQKQQWTLKLGANLGAAPFELSLPDKELASHARSLAAVHNQWMGWMFGNNPASVSIPHEMGWYPMIQGLYSIPRASTAALEKQLLFFADTGVDPSGYVWPRWSVGGYYKPPWGNLHDQIPHFILAMYFHALSTGSKSFLQRVMPTVDRVAGYLLALDGDHDGVVEIPQTSGLADGAHECSNWWDIIKFGHKDAYINAYCCMALNAMAEMKAWLGDVAAAERYRAEHRRFVDGFNKVFWDDQKGFYMDWIDVREKMPESGRRYFYTDQNLLAIIFGMADAGKSKRILENLDRRYDELCAQFKLPREAIWATPANMFPISQPGDMVDFGKLGDQAQFPNYENGCSFFHTTGLEIAARGVAGQPDKAYETFERVMRQGYARNRLWGAALKWDTGELQSEPLNNSLLILWGFTRGCFGLQPSFEGLKSPGSPPAKLIGARYTFGHLGMNVTATAAGPKGDPRVVLT
ncbi:MAG TPA: GH116 family glycosyl hydrolase [Terriglobia bacterium]|nr:GH116 family glycosyl hydrolase [Terriglobia bacterium]